MLTLILGLSWGGSSAEAAYPKDYRQGRRACLRAELDTCREAGNELLKTSQPDLGVDLLHRACLLGATATCERLGRLLLRGGAASPDPAMAADVFERACLAGRMASCNDAGWVYRHGVGVDPDPRKAATYLHRACRSGVTEACQSMALMRSDPPSEHGDPPAALCEAGDLVSCMAVGVRWIAQGQPAAAVGPLSQACAGEQGESCGMLGMVFVQGANGVERDWTRGTSYLLRACELEHGDSCMSLGMLHQTGMGVERDPHRAEQLFERACTLGEQQGCEARTRHGGTGHDPE